MSDVPRTLQPRNHWKSASTAALIATLPSVGPICAVEAQTPFTTTSTRTLVKQTYCYKQVGDCKIYADVHRHGEEKNRPAIVWIHGGALISGHRENLQPVQLGKYLGAGFNVISIDYRLAPETKLKFIIEDLRDAFKWARQRGPALAGIDPDRIAVVGHSAGGYLALMSGFCAKPRPRAIVSFYGYGDIAGEWYSRPDPFYARQPAVARDEAYGVVGHGVISEATSRERFRFYLYCRQTGLWPNEVAGHDPIKQPKAFDPFCPIRNVTRKYPPTLLLHGDQDTHVPYAQSVLMAQKLEQHRVEHELITMTNRGHGFDGGRRATDDAEVARAFDKVVDFLKAHTAQ